ncbi:Alcohol dehydrogenase [acceptor] [Rubripirellula tenax]|uniref:Alcohol dehydrogenase [acceptor] n=1 Tax=Rubripirellula tenax TaxID=2528015 RepID=A0A5C6FIB9_9BACT|nr:GMC oxidoreductase [Rubripirellula tenax]TWU60333.1 Alcohol dehydrogenase [acceptor] [Rubripirellula tenax]
MEETDLIVVGSGAAACVLAYRLRQQSGLRITVVEPESDLAPAIDRERPSRWLKLIGSKDDWKLKTEPCDRLASRRIDWPRGRGIGGSTRINAMIWFPPTATDFANWETACGGQRSIDQWRAAASDVESLVQPETPRFLSDASQQFMAATSGFANAEPMIYRRINRNGRRTDFSALLDGAGVVRGTADRVLWHGERAVGVNLVQGDRSRELRSRCGVVLCAGAIGTPSILMRSGIGPAEDLSRHDIIVRVDRPNVGRRLQDHLVMPVIFETKSKNIFRLDPAVRDVAKWMVTGAGSVSSNIAECGGLFDGGRFQVHVTPTNYLTFPKLSDTAMMTIAINLTRPRSSGTVTLSSPHACSLPVIQGGYGRDDRDIEELVEGVEMVRSIARGSGLGEWVERELIPGQRREGEQAIRKAISRYAQTLYHPTGSCQFGNQIDSPVDVDFKVRGFDGLWAVDASVLPSVTTGNPTASVMTMAWVAAESIAGTTVDRS